VTRGKEGHVTTPGGSRRVLGAVKDKTDPCEHALGMSNGGKVAALLEVCRRDRRS
jgi:hypothetical protein